VTEIQLVTLVRKMRTSVTLLNAFCNCVTLSGTLALSQTAVWKLKQGIRKNKIDSYKCFMPVSDILVLNHNQTMNSNPVNKSNCKL